MSLSALCLTLALAPAKNATKTEFRGVTILLPHQSTYGQGRTGHYIPLDE